MSTTEANQQTVLEWGKWEGKHEGIDYFYELTTGKTNRGRYLKVSVSCISPGSFKITKENMFDHFFKKVGICIEITTGDSLFDDKFFINTNAVEFSKLYFAKSQNRKSVDRIFEKGFNRIEYDGIMMTAVYTNPPRHFDMTKISAAAAQLIQMTKYLPPARISDAFESNSWKIKRAIVFAIPTLVLFLPLIISYPSGYGPMDSGTISLISLAFSIPLWFIFMWMAVKLLKGRSSSHLEFLTVLFFSLLVFISVGVVITKVLNSVLDKSQPVAHKTVIISKTKSSKSEGRNSYYIEVKSWRKNGMEGLYITPELYRRVVPRNTKITVTTKAGALGFEWIVNYKIHF